MNENDVLKVFNSFGFTQTSLFFTAINLLPISVLCQYDFGWIIIIGYSSFIYYFLSVIFIKRVRFYNNFMEIVYPTRFVLKQKHINYVDIVRVRHNSYNGRGPSGIIIKIKNKNIPISIDIKDHKQRIRILEKFKEFLIPVIGSSINE